MINKINKERRRSMNTTPTRPSNKNQLQGAQTDPKQNRDIAKLLLKQTILPFEHKQKISNALSN
jgi:hypothetical protein